MTMKEIGKIENIRFGFGGYQDAMIGLSVTLSGKAWGVGDFKGFWTTECRKGCEWTETDRVLRLGEVVLFIQDLLTKAKKTDVAQLKGVPVEAIFEGNALKSWRILEEVL